MQKCRHLVKKMLADYINDIFGVDEEVKSVKVIGVKEK
jgi:hypothetical protein